MKMRMLFGKAGMRSVSYPGIDPAQQRVHTTFRSGSEYAKAWLLLVPRPADALPCARQTS